MAEPPTIELDGSALRKLRMSSGREMRDLAAAAGITRSYLNRLETGTRRRTSPTVFLALRKALNATEQQLLPTEDRDTDEVTCPPTTSTPIAATTSGT